MSSNNPSATLQHILQQQAYVAQTPHTSKVLQQLKNCRTAALGYHVYKCVTPECTNRQYVYHSCRNRHCPQCGNLAQAQWLDDRRTELLPINYYHVVFTVPHELNSIIMGNRKQLFKILFDSSAHTLLQFASDKKYLNAKPGIISVLHTWGQNLSFHPHVHCIVSGGGIAIENGKAIWKNGTRNADGFLFPVLAMSQVYKAIMIKAIRQLIKENKLQLLDQQATLQMLRNVYEKDWVVYAKEPFNGPQNVLEYLAKYTHRVAISNNRIKTIDDTKVSFAYKDYADNSRAKTMSITQSEFIRRFEQHILPSHFSKIRSYGYISNRNRSKNILLITKLMCIPLPPQKVTIPWFVLLFEKFGKLHDECDCCKKRSMTLVEIVFGKEVIEDG